MVSVDDNRVNESTTLNSTMYTELPSNVLAGRMNLVGSFDADKMF